MKILMMIDRIGRGGLERQMKELLVGLKAFPEVQVEILTFSPNILYPGIRELGYPIHILNRRFKKDPLVFYQVYKICKKIRPDIVHSWSGMSSIYILPAVLALDFVFINGVIRNVAVRTNRFDYKLLRARFSFRFSDIVLANSKAGLESYGAPKGKGHYILNGIDPGRTAGLSDPKVMRQKFNIRTSKVVGMVAGFYERKDYATFLKAAMILLDKNRDVSFLAIGKGPMLEKIKSGIPPKYQNHILFPGMQEDVESLVNLFDVGVLATNARIHGEGISNSIMEYMMLGKPVVATDSGGTAEIVKDGETGFLVPAFDADVMADRMERLLNDSPTKTAMGECGKHWIAEAFSLERMTENYYNLYHETLNNQHKNVDRRSGLLHRSQTET